MQVDYVNHMGDDLSVVNAARVSFAKESKEFSEADGKLISYLARNQHWTPFAHTAVTLRMKAPIFIRTQCFKHKQGFVENEVSRRYVDDAPLFFSPDVWRSRPTNGAKQGSGNEVVKQMVFQSDVETWSGDINMFYSNLMDSALQTYNGMLEAGVAPEQARMVLPQSMYTEWYWTGSLAAYARFFKQRTDPHAQVEIQELAKMVGEIIQPLYPASWEALTS